MSNTESGCGNPPQIGGNGSEPEANDALLRKFLKVLDPDRKCWSFCAFPEADGSPSHKHITNELGKILALNKQGAGCYFAINEFPKGHTGRRADEVTRLRLVAADGDDAPLPEVWPLEPHVVIKRTCPTTGNVRWQAFWRIDDADSETTAENIKAWRQIMLGIIGKLGTDPKVKDLPRVMRLPYTNHWKTNTPHQYRTHMIGRQPAYRLADLLAAFPPPPDADVSGEVASNAATAEGSVADNAAALIRAIRWLEAEEDDGGAPESHQGNRDNTTHFVAKRLADYGLSVPAIYELLRSNYNPTKCHPPLDDDDLTRLAKGAHIYRGSPVGTDDPQHIVSAFNEPIPDRYATEAAKPRTSRGRTNRKDLPRLLAEHSREHDFPEGIRWVPELRCFFVFTGTHWKPLHSDHVKTALNRRAPMLGKIKVQQHTLVSGALENLKNMSADETASKKLLAKEHRPIFNFMNGELHLDTATGGADLRPHDPRSYQTHCFPFDFEDGAVCPNYQKALLKTFSSSSDPEDMIRHFEEAGGFFMSSSKRIPAMFLFHGSGNNGKSAARAIFELILPPEATLAVDISHAETNRHFSADLLGKLLVVDDDVKAGAKLPDGFIKTVSENKTISGNPKGLPQVTFTNTAAVLLLANNYPSASDLTDGTRRRLHVIPFEHRFSAEERDLHLIDKLRAERPGIFNRFLAGLQRLLQRGDFQDPGDCSSAKARWFENANPLVRFVEETCEQGVKLRAPAQQLFDAYTRWASDEKLTRPLSRHGFKQKLEDIGYWNVRDCAGRYYAGLALKPSAEGDPIGDHDFGPDLDIDPGRTPVSHDEVRRMLL